MNKLFLFTLIAIQAQFSFSMESSQAEAPKWCLPGIIHDASWFKKEDPKRSMVYREAQKLLISGANPDIIQAGEPLLIEATTRMGDLEEFVSLLCQYKANVNLTDRDGNTALIKATQLGKLNIVRILLEHRANPNIKGENGKTALMEGWRSSDIQDLLLKYNTDLDLQDNEGNTALLLFVKRNYAIPHVAVRINDEEQQIRPQRVKFLDYFPNCSLKNNEGKTALDIARQNNNTELIEQLSNVPKLEKLP